MNHRSVPDWSSRESPRAHHDHQSAMNPPKPLGFEQEDTELIELLWCNGHVVMQSQTSRPPPARCSDYKAPKRPELASKPAANEDSTPLFQYPLLDDSLEKEFFSDLFDEMPALDASAAPALAFDGNAVFSGPELGKSMLLPPKPHATAVAGKHDAEAGESSSMVTIGSSICGSNRVHATRNEGAIAQEKIEDPAAKLLHAGASVGTRETTVTSSTGKSNCSFRRSGQQSTSTHSNKRKAADMEESNSHSEQEAEFESAKANNKPAARTAASRRSRAAEVHNLSERRRRDRINEKMKALQELIPHSNKTDKASMLDEAIEYLKSLQLQVQMMWMGNGMAQMMFHGVPLPHLGVGMSPVPSPVQLQRAQYMNQAFGPNAMPGHPTPCQPPNFSAASFQGNPQIRNLPDQFSRLVGFNQMQLPSQAVNCYPFGGQTIPHVRTPVTPAPEFSSGGTQFKKSD